MAAPEATGLARIRAGMRKRGALFFLSAVVPTALVAAYHGLWSSDVYVSESRFVVRSPEKQAGSPLGLILRGAGFTRAQEEIVAVHEYILSRDALRALDDRIGLKGAYSAASVDRLSRFAGIDPDDSFEALHRYYVDKVGLTIDNSSSVATLTVRAFTARDAFEANRVLLEDSEELVNRLNERGRRDMVKYAEREVRLAEEQVRTAAAALSAFRNRQGVVDPERQAAGELQQIARLREELHATQVHLAQVRSVAPGNPQLGALETRRRALQQTIEGEADRLTGSSRSLANKAADFQRHTLELEFASRQLASALASLEQSRNDAQRQQVYLERIASPSLPDRAQEPRRWRAVAATALLGLLFYALARLAVAGVNEHRS